MTHIQPTALVSISLISLALTACQAPVVNPNSPTGQAGHIPRLPYPSQPSTPSTPPKAITDTDIITDELPQPTPAQQPPKNVTTPTKRVTAKDIVAQQQRHQQQTSHTRASQPRHQKYKDGTNIPAFNRLMKRGISQLRANKLAAAQTTFTKAQRLGPQSPAVYMYLSEIAIKRRQGTQAENLARRGLLVSRSKRYDKALWQMILISAKMRQHTATISEAQKQLDRLR